MSCIVSRAVSLYPGQPVQVAAPVGTMRRVVLAGVPDTFVDSIAFDINGTKVLEIGPSIGWVDGEALTGGEVARQLANLRSRPEGPLSVDFELGMTIPEQMTPAGILTVCGVNRLRRPCGMSVLFIFDK